MPLLRVSLWSGRTKTEKAELARALTETMVRTATVPAEAVTVVFEEFPKENWATAGQLHSERFADR